ncbi:hypothetical protein QYM36_002948, partial [Artemia franciscana]
ENFKLLSTKMWNFIFLARRQITAATSNLPPFYGTGYDQLNDAEIQIDDGSRNVWLFKAKVAHSQDEWAFLAFTLGAIKRGRKRDKEWERKRAKFKWNHS